MSPERDSSLRAGTHSVPGPSARKARNSALETPLLLKRTAAALFLSALVGVGSAYAGETKAVLELFTSQGCSSCPPADELLAEYAERNDILALSFNVDYWDMRGWEDTLASHDYTERQRNYATARGDGQIYTPQMVVDGRMHVVGSSKKKVDAALDEAHGLPVPVSLSMSGDSVSVRISAASDQPHATLWLVMYDKSVTVPIERGENSGRTLTYTNVVRKLRPIAMWKGAAMSVDLPRSEIAQAKVGSCAVLLQAETKEGLPGPILGAATIRAGW